MENKKQEKKQSKWAWTITIIVTVLAILSAVIGIYGLIDGYDVPGDNLSWFSITIIVLGFVIAALSWLTFSQKIQSRNVWAWSQVIWTLSSIGIIVVGVLATIQIHNKAGLIWLPICATINGGLLLIDKINYLINHFVRINKEAKAS